MKNQIIWHNVESLRAATKRVGVRNVALGMRKRGYSLQAAVWMITGHWPTKPV